ncbi:organic cation transporter protein-like isoform X2 [Homarus americanus]|uniref:organic cation transporter protein-like isoform X2 n=1 Tax=Homarus americanus TaxID=6706 RepID=UPI001C466A2C|nr:organic cation transporter protein-like isoform X2 [Homarus americanus]
MAVDIDAVLREIGSFGVYQRRVYFLLCLPIIFVGAGNLAFVFIAATPKYRCLVPECDENFKPPTYDEPFVNFTIPYSQKLGSLDECHRYQRLNTNDSCNAEDYSTNVTVGCPEGKVFSQNHNISTIVTEFNLTCHDAWQTGMSQTVYFAGVLVGAFIFGIIADLIGRRLTLMFALVAMAVSGVITALVAGLIAFNVVRFISAMVTTAVFQTAFVLGVEYVGPENRVMCGILGEYFYAFGEVLLGLMSWWLKGWRMTQLVISAPVSCFIFYGWFIPESPRWLQAQGKEQKLVAALEKIAKRNGKSFPYHLIRNQDSEYTTDDALPRVKIVKAVSMVDIFKTPLLCVRMVAMFFIWIVTTLVYYGLSLHASDLGSGDSFSRPYVDFILASLVELPGYTLAWIGMSCWGRRGSLALSMILAGISCAGAGFASEYSQSYVLIPALLGKCFITCAFGIIYVFASEIFPTSVRSTIIGLCSTSARFGAMLAPFSNDLSLIYGPLPMIVFGVLSLVAGLLNIVMPETLNTSLPETVADALHLGRGRSVAVQETGSPEEEQCLLNDDDDDDEFSGQNATQRSLYQSVEVSQQNLEGKPDHDS